MNKLKKRIIILSIITSILFLIFILVVVMMILENGKCVDDPFKYSAIKLKQSGGNYACSCMSLDVRLADFSFSEEGIKILEENYFKINY